MVRSVIAGRGPHGSDLPAIQGNAPMITETAIARISGLTLRALQNCERESYADRMLRHALAMAMKARAAMRRGDEPEARRLMAWGLGSVRLAIAAGTLARVA